jgi:hypothetical protein
MAKVKLDNVEVLTVILESAHIIREFVDSTVDRTPNPFERFSDEWFEFDKRIYANSASPIMDNVDYVNGDKFEDGTRFMFVTSKILPLLERLAVNPYAYTLTMFVIEKEE